MQRIFFLIVFFLTLTVSTQAFCMKTFLGVYEGYGNNEGMYKNDGQTARARLTLGIRSNDTNPFYWGFETGIQSENSGRLIVSSIVYETLGGLPIEVRIKPMMDFLFTLRTHLHFQEPIYFFSKIGLAYRQLQFTNRDTIPDIQKVNPEIQLGIGYAFTKNVTFLVTYQGIYSSKNARVSLTGPETARILSIPTEQSGFLGFEYVFN